MFSNHHNKKAPTHLSESGLKIKVAASYSPALHCSTIGAGGLNFSVRNGKRWDPAAITTYIWGLTPCTQDLTVTTPSPETITSDNNSTAKAFGQLVVLGFDVTVFTPAPYQRHRL